MEIKGFERFYQSGGIFNHRKDLANNNTWVLSKSDGEEVVADNCVTLGLWNTSNFDEGKVTEPLFYIEFDCLDDALAFIEECQGETAEVCAHCMGENVMPYIPNRYETICVHCGERLMLCSECIRDGNGKCDWSEAGCYRR